MRTSRLLTAILVSLVLLAAACGDDEDDLDTGASDTTDADADAGAGIDLAPDGSGVQVPDRDPDLVGTVTSVVPFEPVTEDCTPADDLDPDGSVSSDDPPVCTPSDNEIVGTVVVEEQPGVDEGRKISFTVTTTTAITGTKADGVGVGVFGDLAEGQTVDAWVSGDMCAESYPEQCGAEALRVTG